MFTSDRFVLGTMMFGLRASADQIAQIVSRARELGINEFDTSPSYINGQAQLMLSRALKEIRFANAVIHSKVGRSYLPGQPKSEVYVSHHHISESMNIVEKCFSDFKIGTVQVHVYNNLPQLFTAISALAEMNISRNFSGGIGVSNASESILKALLNELHICCPDLNFSCQRRVALGLDNEDHKILIQYWAYGILNSGTMMPSAKNVANSRCKTANDKPDISKRQMTIESSQYYRKACLLCSDYGVNIVDFAIAYPLLSGYEKVVLGPTRQWHLDPVERFCDRNYFHAVVAIYEQLQTSVCHVDYLNH